MKLLKPTLSIVTLVAMAIFCHSCSGIDDDLQNYSDYINSEQYTTDLDNMFYAGTLKHALEIMMVRIDQASSKQNVSEDNLMVTPSYWTAYYNILATLQDHEQEFNESMQRLDEMGVFDVATPQIDADGNVVAMGPRSPFRCNDPESRAMALLATPTQAAPLLLIQSWYEFWGMASDLSLESRKTIITVAQRLSDEDRRTIFNNMGSELKMGQTDYKKWWNSLSDGKYDVKAFRVWQDIIAQQDSQAKTNYLSVADDMDLLSQKQFMSAAGRLVTAGAKLQVEIVHKVIGSSTGEYELYKKKKEVEIDGKKHTIESPVTISYNKVQGWIDKIQNRGGTTIDALSGEMTMDKVQDFALNEAKYAVSDIIDSENMSVAGIGIDGGETFEAGYVLYKIIDDVVNRHKIKKENKLVWGNEEERLAQIKINDKDNSATGKIVVRDKNTGAIFATKVGNFDNNSMSIYVPKGDYNVTAIGEDGNKQTLTGVKTEPGKATTVEVKKTERETYEHLLEMHKNDTDEDFMKWYRGFKAIQEKKKAKIEAENKAKEEAKRKAEEAKAKAAAEAKKKAEEEKAKAEAEKRAAQETDVNAGNRVVNAPEDAMESDKSKFSLTGTWKPQTINHISKAILDDGYKESDVRSVRITFNDNQRFRLYSTLESESITGSYSFDGMTAKLRGTDGEDTYTLICPIIPLGNNKMKITFSGPDMDGTIIVTMVK